MKTVISIFCIASFVLFTNLKPVAQRSKLAQEAEQTMMQATRFMVEKAVLFTIETDQLAAVPSFDHFRSESLNRHVWHRRVGLAMENNGGRGAFVYMVRWRDVFRLCAEPLLGSPLTTAAKIVAVQRRQHEPWIE